MNDQRAHTRRFLSTTYKQLRGCEQKVRYPSKKNATALARVIGGTMNAYRCKLCRHWHLGHAERRTARG